MTNQVMAENYFEKGKAWLRTVELMMEQRAYSDVVRQAAECVELLLKSALRLIGVEPAHTHDPGGSLPENKAKFPDWFQARVDELAAISNKLAEDRGPSFYGDEQRGIPPGQLYGEPEAKAALEQARLVHEVCAQLIGSISLPSKE